MGQKAVRKQTASRNPLGEPCALGLIRIRALPKVSAFEQTRSERVITIGWIGIPDWKLLGKLLATREPKWNLWLMSVPFPDILVRAPAWESRAAQGFCRFPGLDSTEAERLSGESRPLLLLGLSNGVLLKSTYRSDKGNQMNQSTKDEIKANMHEAKGTVKEKAGQVSNNPHLTAEGQNERLAGKIQEKVGQVEEVFEK